MIKIDTSNVITTKLDTKKIIEFAEFLKTKNADAQLQPGIDTLTQMDPEKLQSALEFVLNYAFTEIRVGLGISELPDNEMPDYENMTIFNKVDDLYEEAAGDCYFCSKSVDPNADEFGPKVHLCMLCKLKLANFTESLGIPAGAVFTGMRSRKVQKSKMQIKGVNVSTEHEENQNVTWH